MLIFFLRRYHARSIMQDLSFFGSIIIRFYLFSVLSFFGSIIFRFYLFSVLSFFGSIIIRFYCPFYPNPIYLCRCPLYLHPSYLSFCYFFYINPAQMDPSFSVRFRNALFSHPLLLLCGLFCFCIVATSILFFVRHIVETKGANNEIGKKKFSALLL